MKMMEAEESEAVEKTDQEKMIVFDRCQQNLPDIQETFKCHLCKKTYNTEMSLKRHYRKEHSSWAEINLSDISDVQCPICMRTFRFRASMRWHCRTVHKQFFTRMNFADSEKLMKCVLCEKPYNSKSGLHRHYNKRHQNYVYSSRINKMKCPFPTCDFSCSRLDSLRVHLSKPDTHNITFRCYKRSFKSVEDFKEWKFAEEQKTRASFISESHKYIKYNEIHPVHYYKCSRSGFHKTTSVNTNRKISSKKINGTCPACMTLFIRNEKVELIYHKTHVGHGNELHHQSLSKPQKEYVASKLSRGFSLDKILDDIRNDETFAGQRIKLITKQDIRNLMRSYGIKRDKEELCGDLKNTDAWVTQLKDFSFSPVLFYKPCGIAIDNKHSVFYKKDFVLSIMTEGQKQMFGMLPASVVGIYCSLESNSHHFFLITFFIVDEGGLPFPVAYCLTSRTDDKAVKAFLSLLKDKIGIIKASVFISDRTDVWFSAWTEVMGLPSKHIMYFPYLKHNWKKDMHKTLCCTEKQEQICLLLDNLSTEPDRSKFELLLKSFIDKIESDIDLKEFGTYFKSNFLDKIDMWALCHYADSGLLTVAHLEEMHKRIRGTCFYEDSPKSVDLCIRELLLLTRKYFYEHLSKIYRETDFIEQALILSHKCNEELYSIEIECDEQSNKWKIRTGDDESVYCVRRIDIESPDEMLLYCPLCQMFLDIYTCNCVDYLIMCIICEHIHTIARLSKGCEVISDNSAQDAAVQLMEVVYDTAVCENEDHIALEREGDVVLDDTNLIELVEV